MKKINNSISLAIISALSVPAFTSAATAPCTATNGGVGLCSGNSVSVLGIIRSITSWVLTFAGAVAVLFIIWGGLQYMTAGGNEKRAEAGKQTLTYAVIGLVVILLAQVVVVLVGNAIKGAL